MDKIKTLEDFVLESAKSLGYTERQVDVMTRMMPTAISNKAATHYAEYCCMQQRRIDSERLYKTDEGIEGCIYNDTTFDSQSVCYGYNNAIEDGKESILNAPLFTNQNK